MAADAQAPSRTEREESKGELGLTVQTLTRDLATQLDIKNQKGAVITDVADGSAAAFAGLEPGDVIIEANHQKITNAADFTGAVKKTSGKGTLLLVKRGDQSLFVVLPKK